MELELENIGKIKKANVKIGGLTVIAGENDTGKSTIGKALFTVMSHSIMPLYKIDEKKNNIVRDFLYAEFKKDLLKTNESHGKIKLDWLNIDIEKSQLDNGKYDVKMSIDVPYCVEDNDNVGILNLKYSTPTLIDSPKLLEFSNLIDNSATTIDLIDGKEIIQLHQKNLIYKLEYSSEYEEKISNTPNAELVKIVQNIMGGYWTYDKRTHDFVFTKKGGKLKNTFNSWNIASGIKSFGIIEILLKGGSCLSPKKPLIIDEPEVHLHPEWHIKYAEILIELVKNKIPVIITTHSDSFIESLRVEAGKNNIKIDYAFADFDKENPESSLIMSNKDSYKNIMNALSKPLLKLLNNNE
jgi:predicted ATP-dependent endonuclease of OLD family